MAVDHHPPAPKRRSSGFRQVRDPRDLQPRLDIPQNNRRLDASGVYLSPLRQLTTHIIDTYRTCNTGFRYESTHNPRRVLTKPSKPCHNDGYDNEDYDYILYVNDWLGTEEGHKYLILDVLGQGTFGQVVKCQNMKTHEIVAVKVVKNKPAYFNQSMMEVTILEMLNKNCDPNDEHHILRLRDSFIHKNHLCLVFELLSSNLYELIKQNQFQGLSTQLVKVFMAQLLDSLTVLKDARLIHCDLKPENILLKSLQSPTIKVIDFGSACHERQTVYTYIQSRFYRSPEVLLGLSYNAAIDMWSLGCIAVELFLGLPLFPGTSEYNQLTRIVEMLGLPPLSMLNSGKQTSQFFDAVEIWNPHSNQMEKKYRLKSLEQYSRDHNTNEQPGKQYFKATTLPDIINTAPMPTFKSSRHAHEMERELNNRASFVDFCQGLLNLNPLTRWTPQQARLHPFITGEKFSKPFLPDGATPAPQSTTPQADPKRPYGGLVPSQPKGTRAYQDAASYNQHLAQHQAYTAQAASQANTSYRNPYMNSQTSHSSQSTQSQPPPQMPQPPASYDAGAYQHQPQQQQQSPHRGLSHQSSSGNLNAYTQQYSSPGTSGAHMNPNAPSNSYYPATRGRANTINQIDTVPPALARLQAMNQDIIGRNALTPVMNRDEAIQEWERRLSGKASAAQPYPQLEFLQQQAEIAAASGMGNWAQGAQGRYQAPPSKLSQSYHPQQTASALMVDDKRRDVVMSNVRSAATSESPGGGGSGGMYTGSTSGVISSPPLAYTGNSSSSGNRYTSAYPQQQQHQSPPVQQSDSFDSIDRRGDMSNVYIPMQPEQYRYAGQPNASSGNRHNAAPPSAVGPGFYGANPMQPQQQGQGAPPSQQQRNPFNAGEALPSSAPPVPLPSARRNSGMDIWPGR
ncbi:kinase-like domain-containing protein [Pterulicium gracile]|uniref:Kinase-like domain-containing protein n=1 Tax=Pterulicium gracile TaxID=1884261 RepID=A0A5C3QHP0_9AGAR|nr:kinase-like domain-containing protein [Pterula gracilis]